MNTVDLGHIITVCPFCAQNKARRAGERVCSLRLFVVMDFGKQRFATAVRKGFQERVR